MRTDFHHFSNPKNRMFSTGPLQSSSHAHRSGGGPVACGCPSGISHYQGTIARPTGLGVASALATVLGPATLHGRGNLHVFERSCTHLGTTYLPPV